MVGWPPGGGSVWFVYQENEEDIEEGARSSPTDPNREGSFAPVSACYYGHLAEGVGAWTVEYLV